MRYIMIVCYVLGFVDYDQSKKGEFDVINLVLLLAKFHIHKSKFLKDKPLIVFMKEYEKYQISIKLSEK